jgi:hypothetical protein
VGVIDVFFFLILLVVIGLMGMSEDFGIGVCKIDRRMDGTNAERSSFFVKTETNTYTHTHPIVSAVLPAQCSIEEKETPIRKSLSLNPDASRRVCVNNTSSTEIEKCSGTSQSLLPRSVHQSE